MLGEINLLMINDKIILVKAIFHYIYINLIVSYQLLVIKIVINLNLLHDAR